MTQSRFDTLLRRLGSILGALVMVLILVPAAYIGYKVLRELFFPKIGQNAVVNVNQETGEKEYLTLGRFNRIQGTQLLVASLGAQRQFKDIYYESYGATIRNYLFYDIQTKRSRWLLQNNSSLLLRTHELLKDPSVRANGVTRDWQTDREVFKDENAAVVSIVYEGALSDTNRDGRLSEEDKKTLMFFNLAGEKALNVLENIDDILGVEQTSAEEALVFFTNEQKNYVLTINAISGKVGEKTELLNYFDQHSSG